MQLSIHKLKESNEFLNTLYDSITSAIFVADSAPRIFSFNDAMKTMLHKADDRIINELCGNVLGCMHHVSEGADCGHTSRCESCLLRRKIAAVFSGGDYSWKEPFEREFLIGGKIIHKHYLLTVRGVVFDAQTYALIILDDISEIEENKRRIESNNRSLEKIIMENLSGLVANGASLTCDIGEPEFIHEIHHRVGNNLQVVLSLLRLEMRNSSEKPAIATYSEIERRISAIRLLYNYIVLIGASTFVDMKRYIGYYVADIITPHNCVRDLSDITMNSGEIYLSIEQAIPVSLIIDECINCYIKKNPARRPDSKMSVSLRLNDSGRIMLQIENPFFRRTEEEEGCLAVNLIRLLSEQLQANLTLDTDTGFDLRLTLPSAL